MEAVYYPNQVQPDCFSFLWSVWDCSEKGGDEGVSRSLEALEDVGMNRKRAHNVAYDDANISRTPRSLAYEEE